MISVNHLAARCSHYIYTNSDVPMNSVEVLVLNNRIQLRAGGEAN
jgi:hypothetical protein